MKEITYLYLKGGEEIITNMESEEDNPMLKLHDPRRLMMVPQQGQDGQQGFGMSMLPWPLVGKDNPTVELDKSNVVFMLSADSVDDKLKTQYLAMITNLVIPGKEGIQRVK